jgi:hypothetical protein
VIPPRPSTAFLQALAGAALLLAAAGGHAAARRAQAEEELRAQAALVRRLELTDLCVFTDARYTRHPSQADAFSPFQDHPRALDHYPSGSLVRRPR